MKKFSALLTFMMSLTIWSSAQILAPVHWSYAAKKSAGNTAQIFIKANLDPGWHIYSQHVKDGGPVKTTVKIDRAKEYIIVGRTAEPKAISRYEKVFGMEVSFFENEVIFQQKIKLRKSQVMVKGTVEFMTCNDAKCLPPETVEFNIPVK